MRPSSTLADRSRAARAVGLTACQSARRRRRHRPISSCATAASSRSTTRGPRRRRWPSRQRRDRRRRHRTRDDRALRRAGDAGDRPRGPARDSRLHRGPRALHRRRRGASSISNLMNTKSWDEIVRDGRRTRPRGAKPGEWIVGRGWHQEKWTSPPQPNVEGFPTHQSLEHGVAEQPGVLDARERPRVVRQREGDGARRTSRATRRIRPAARS